MDGDFVRGGRSIEADMRPQEFALKLGLTLEEYGKIEKGLGREPNENELGMFSVMWSEHCSYKNTRRELRKFPTSGPAVLVKAGRKMRGWWMREMGWRWRIRSSRTIIRVRWSRSKERRRSRRNFADIFTMGARPVAFMDSLRFGRPEAKGRRENGRGR